jgi:hypothetical protein
MVRQPLGGIRRLIFSRFHDHTLRHTTVGRTPLDERPARRRELYLTTHNTHKRQTFMLPGGFEPAIPASERPQTHALDRAATGIGSAIYTVLYYCFGDFLGFFSPHGSTRVIGPSQRPLPENTQRPQETDIHVCGGIRTHNPSKRAAVDLRLRTRGHFLGYTYIHTLHTYIHNSEVPDNQHYRTTHSAY